VTRDAAALVAILALMGGWYGRKLWQANDDVKGLRQRLANAQRLRRWALGVAALVGAAIYAAAYHWVHTGGG
jgi:hypothetical protein